MPYGFLCRRGEVERGALLTHDLEDAEVGRCDVGGGKRDLVVLTQKF